MRAWMIFFAGGLVLLAGGCPDPAGTDTADTDMTADQQGVLPADADAAGLLDRVLVLVNQERAAAGLGALSRSAQLDQAAERHTADMRDNEFFSHTGSDGTQAADRVNDTGYQWARVGENLAQGSNTPEEVVQRWMDSEGHRANILQADFTEIGLAVTDGGPLWAQVFARPLGAP